MTYQETLDFLYNALPMYQRVGNLAFKKDLTNTISLCKALGNPQEKFKSIHVAGTNGKGSSSHLLAAILQEAGYKTGLYTSPHLKNFSERIKINGTEVSRNYVVDFVRRIKPQIEAIKPSFFEITVAMAFDYFAREAVDIAVIEVGLGGRLDSTNVIDPLLSLITNIGYDHMDMLGNTLPLIAGEKAGIIKSERPVVISQLQHEVSQVFESKARQMNASILFAAKIYQVNHLHTNLSGASYQVLKEGRLLFPRLESALAGSYQLYNIPGVLAAIDQLRCQHLNIEDKHILSGFKKVNQITGLKGRWQVLSEKPLTICDVAHNAEGLQMVIDQLLLVTHNKLHLVLGMVKDKNAEAVFKFLPKEANYYFCEPDLPRAKPAEELQAIAKRLQMNSQVIKNVNEAITAARMSADEKDVVFIGGSSFVVAEIENL